MTQIFLELNAIPLKNLGHSLEALTLSSEICFGESKVIRCEQPQRRFGF